MKIVIQRVQRASVRVGDELVAEIGHGLLILVGVRLGDEVGGAKRLADKTAALRIFANEDGRFDRSVRDVGGEALVVSQFTLHADVRRGNRPNFTRAAAPDVAARLVEAYAKALEDNGVPVSRGRFGAMMAVDLLNDGPVTIVIDARDLLQSRRQGARELDTMATEDPAATELEDEGTS